ncbi:MAG TPA: hypothetical protein VFY45_07330 [Baekduia sp.]|nr:hypothetical protein [Baekduia sp.]
MLATAAVLTAGAAPAAAFNPQPDPPGIPSITDSATHGLQGSDHRQAHMVIRDPVN